MNLGFTAMALLWAAMIPTSAAPMCGTGTLSSYLALGVGGCNVGSSTFTGFELLGLPPGATGINPMSVGVLPTNIAYAPQLTFTVNQNAASGQLFELLFGYKVAGAVITGQTNSLSGSFASGGGLVTVVGDSCADGVFAPQSFSGCSGTSSTSILVDDGFFPTTSQQVLFSGAKLLNVVTDIVVDGGAGGAASLTSVTTQLQTVPEPASILITAAGLSMLLFARFQTKKEGKL